MPQSQVAIIFLCMSAYDANLPPHHTVQNVVQLARGLETPSQCLLCERLFKLNWYFCNAALSGRSGRRIPEALTQRTAHCGRSVPKVGCHSSNSMANVKGHCGSWNATVEVWNQSESDKAHLFLCLCSGLCIVWLRACVNVYLYVCLCWWCKAWANCV